MGKLINKDEKFDGVTERIAVIKFGYVHEDPETITDNEVVTAANSYRAAKIRLYHHLKKTGAQKNDYFLVKQEFDGLHWVGVEGSEVLF